MAEQTKIEWTDATWNPITGCTLVDDGCRNCYAAELAATRLKTHPSRAGLARKNASGVAKFTGEVRFNDQWLAQPLGWRKPRMVFVCAHGDLFHESVPDQWIDQVFAVMALSPQHTFQVLTKRPDRAREYLSHLQARIYWNDIAVKARAAGITLLGDMSYLRQHELGPLPNVWLGTSISDQASADARIPELLATPAAVRFLSAEPLLGPVDLEPYVSPAWSADDAEWPKLGNLDWIIVGGESGRNARPMHPDWARSLRDQCQQASVAFFFKQAGAWTAWEFASPPYLRNAFTGEEQDRHALLPDRETFDCGRDWDDGLEFVPESSHAVFQRIGKKAAGRLLDGREWSEVPGCL
ncbi:phage Gp37/Gp68 family protein [Marinovum algicola]|uniref:phage Gp37/Gp68 family protein n=1 Tax=Marinovum algicola TaxID=42444 RepID=UPI0024BBAD56|nr:phage Gp37/Gp68 family protein [Marinovum algicola]